jgi:hypothetical protein
MDVGSRPRVKGKKGTRERTRNYTCGNSPQHRPLNLNVPFSVREDGINQENIHYGSVRLVSHAVERFAYHNEPG